jgi:hypothetical protein
MVFVLIWRVFSLLSHKECERQLRPGLEIRSLSRVLRVRVRVRARARARARARGREVKEIKEIKRHDHFRVIGGLGRVRAIAITTVRVMGITRTKAKARVKGVSQIQRQTPLILAALQHRLPSPICGIRVSSRLREILMTRF